MFIARIILSSSLIVLTLSQVTNIVRSNPLLSRKRRYLAFPMKSNLVKKRRPFILKFKAVLGVKIFREVSGSQGFQDVCMQIFVKSVGIAGGTNGIRVDNILRQLQNEISFNDKSFFRILIEKSQFCLFYNWENLSGTTSLYKPRSWEISIALSKALMRAQPRGWNTVVECDVPFPLPSDTKLFKKHKRTHRIQRRELLTGLEAALTQSGFDGKACLEKMICEAQNYVYSEGKSLTKDILSTIFNVSDINSDHRSDCLQFSSCEFSFFNFILTSMHY